jgi:uncharacterized protein
MTATSPAVRRVFYNSSELRAGWRLFIFLAIVIACLKASNLAIARLLPGVDSTTVFLVGEAMDFLIFLFASWIMGRIEGRTIADYGLPARAMFRHQFWQGAVLGFATLTGLLFVLRAFGLFYFGNIALHGLDVAKWAAVYAFVFLLVALREEFRMRGYGLFTLSAGIGFWPAAIASSALFGYGHRGNSGEDWIGVFNAGAFGLLACFLLRRTGNLWMAIGFHLTFDWGETYFYGVADSGNVLPGHLFNSSSAGPGWLSGGTVGPEGSVFCTLTIVVLWLLCRAWLRETNYPSPALSHTAKPGR